MAARAPSTEQAFTTGTFSPAYRAQLALVDPDRDTAHAAVREWRKTLDQLDDERRAAERQAEQFTLQQADCER